MADQLITVKRGGTSRKMTQKKFDRYFKDKGYEKIEAPKEKKASK